MLPINTVIEKERPAEAGPCSLDVMNRPRGDL